MKYKLLPVINESDLREALFAQYDVEFNIYDYFWLENEYDVLFLDMASYGNCCDDEGYTEMMVILGYLNDIFPQYDAVIIRDN